jgi:hypothetical protein
MALTVAVTEGPLGLMDVYGETECVRAEEDLAFGIT